MDHIDKATARETELRDDALAKLKRRYEAQHARESATHCTQCDTHIPLARQRAVPGVQLCVHCQSQKEQAQKGFAP